MENKEYPGHNSEDFFIPHNLFRAKLQLTLPIKTDESSLPLKVKEMVKETFKDINLLEEPFIGVQRELIDGPMVHILIQSEDDKDKIVSLMNSVLEEVNKL